MLRAFAFRFGFLLLGQWALPLGAPSMLLGGRLWLSPVLEALGLFVGRTLGLDVPVHEESGAGDTLLAWCTALGQVLLALIGATVWTLAQRRVTSHPKLADALQLTLRMALAGEMASYGVIKLFGDQFPAPSDGRLVTTFGDASPMGLLWTTMGASFSYQFFGGALELLGGALLLWRRTSLLGAVLLLGVMGNVVMLNFSYDVPVKLFSAQLWLMAAWLVWPHALPLFHALLGLRPLQPVELGWRFFASGRWVAVRAVLTLVLAAPFLLQTLGYTFERLSMVDAPPNPLVGVYELERVVDGETTLRRLSLTDWSAYAWLGDGPPHRVAVELDEPGTHVALSPRAAEPGFTATFDVTRSDGHYLFKGTLDEHPLTFEAKRLDLSKSLLRTRGFHLVNEFPFNR